MDMIKTITDWPAIVQGVLGSALFWIILELGQQSFRHISTKLGKDKTTAKSFALTAHEAAGELQVTARFFCLYGSAHYFVKAMIVVIISLAVENLVQIFSIVGYLIAIYFLFRALSFVPHTNSLGTLDERKKRLEEILKNARI